MSNPQGTENALNENYAFREGLYRSLAVEAPLRGYTSAESLESLALLHKMNKEMLAGQTPEQLTSAEVDNLDPIQSSYYHEAKYLHSALKALKDDQVLRSKFGMDLAGAQALGAIMRQSAMEEETRQRIQSYLPEQVRDNVKSAQSGGNALFRLA